MPYIEQNSEEIVGGTLKGLSIGVLVKDHTNELLCFYVGIIDVILKP